MKSIKSKDPRNRRKSSFINSKEDILQAVAEATGKENKRRYIKENPTTTSLLAEDSL